MVLGTAAPGGAFAVYGQALATLISDITKVPTSTQQTQGPNQNLVLVQTRRANLGMTTMGPAWEALNGELEIARGVRHTDLRALFPMYETPFQIVSLQRQGAANITSVAQLDGKTVGVGPRAGTPGTYFPRWFRDLGVNVTIRNGSASDMASQIADGRLDAFAFAAGIPIPAFTELETQTRINFFTFTSEQIDRIIPTNPYVSRFTIPAGTYRTLSEQQVTLAMWNFAFCHRELPDDLAYEIMKGVLENQQRLVTAIRAAETTKPENLVHNTFMPFHPGAVRYYREKGLTVRPQLVPSS
jgi:TRAP transporter TAXI family solute receptor